MVGLADYLDALSPPRDSRRGFASLDAPVVGVPGIHDAEMWALDVRWAPPRSTSGTVATQGTGPKAYWQSAVRCVRTAAIGSGWISQDWSVTGAAGCVNTAGVRQAPKCPWGVWHLRECSSDTIALSWQGTRYLWAQQKMRELLAITPSRADAAQWVWSAYQLMSVLLWSTNVRFNNPQPRAFVYGDALKQRGLIYGGALDLQSADWNRPDATVRSDRGVGVAPALVPISRADFSPSFSPFQAVDGRQTFDLAFVTPAMKAAFPVIGVMVDLANRPARSDRDREAPSSTFATWMDATWGADTLALPQSRPASAASGVMRPAADYTVAVAGAQRILADTRAMLSFYIGIPFLRWQTEILNIYQVEMGPFTATLPGADQLAFSAGIADFAARASALQAASWNQGEVASYVMAGMVLVASAVNPLAGAIMAIGIQLQAKLVEFLGDIGALASGFSVCPAFPFLRVPDPPCDALAGPVDAVGLPVDPPPGPVRLTPQQVATLRSLRTLTPSQQRLLARPLVLVTPTLPPPPPPTASPKGGGVLVGVGALALLALLLKRR